MEGQGAQVQKVANNTLINKPSSNYVILFRDDSDGKYYAKLPNGTVEPIDNSSDERVPFGNDTGAANAYQVSLPTVPALIDGLLFEMRIGTLNGNTTNSTLQINALGISPILDQDFNQLQPGMLDGDSIYLFVWNQPKGCFQLLGLAKSNFNWILNGNSNGSLKSIGTNDNFDFPIIVDGVEITRLTTDKRQFWNSPTTNNGSNAGLQYNSLIANRAQLRNNQYGANNAGPGLTTFKSRGLVIGAPLDVTQAVQVGDIIQGFTGIAVTGSGLLIPIAYTQRVTAIDVTSGNVACDWELSLCPIGGATNSIRKVFAVSSEGILRVRESANSMAGLAVLDGAGTAVVANTNVKANTRITLTAQDGGAAPAAGIIYLASRVVGTSFTIQANPGAAMAGVQVYYQLYEPQA